MHLIKVATFPYQLNFSHAHITPYDPMEGVTEMGSHKFPKFTHPHYSVVGLCGGPLPTKVKVNMNTSGRGRVPGRNRSRRMN